MIRDHIAANLGIEPDDFEYAPFAQEGGLGRGHQLFEDRLSDILYRTESGARCLKEEPA